MQIQPGTFCKKENVIFCNGWVSHLISTWSSGIPVAEKNLKAERHTDDNFVQLAKQHEGGQLEDVFGKTAEITNPWVLFTWNQRENFQEQKLLMWTKLCSNVGRIFSTKRVALSEALMLKMFSFSCFCVCFGLYILTTRVLYLSIDDGWVLAVVRGCRVWVVGLSRHGLYGNELQGARGGVIWIWKTEKGFTIRDDHYIAS